MLTSTILFTTFVALTSALPSPVVSKRAGGPVASPIPSSCTVTNPMPSASSNETYFPSTKGALLTSAYYPSPSTNKTALSQQCLQQCYGYGSTGECKAAYWAENVPVPAGYYGSPGGQLETSCLFFTRPLEAADFVVAPEDQATTPFAGNIEC